jgi:hypothetical protein
MVKYNLINKLKEQGLFDSCISSGIISYNYANWTDLYEFYKHQLTVEPSKMQCITNTATKFSYSETRTREIINIIKC